MTIIRVLVCVALVVLALGCSAQREPASLSDEPGRDLAPSTAPAPQVMGPAAIATEPANLSSLAGHRICLDPGHDAFWAIGASGRNVGGIVPRHPTEQVPLYEHELTLSVAYRLKVLLEAEGAQVCVTRLPREQGGGLQIAPYDFTGDGRVRSIGQTVEDVPEVTQPRIDWANAFGAEVLVSIHFNGSDDRSVRGSEAYYSDTGPRQAENQRLAELELDGLVASLRAGGYPAAGRGLRSDRYQRYSAEDTRRLFANNAAVIRAHGYDPANCADCYRLLTLGNNPMSIHPGNYAGALLEVEYLSNVDVVESLMLRPDALDLIAAGLLEGLRRYFETD